MEARYFVQEARQILNAISKSHIRLLSLKIELIPIVEYDYDELIVSKVCPEHRLLLLIVSRQLIGCSGIQSIEFNLKTVLQLLETIICLHSKPNCFESTFRLLMSLKVRESIELEYKSIGNHLISCFLIELQTKSNFQLNCLITSILGTNQPVDMSQIKENWMIEFDRMIESLIQNPNGIQSIFEEISRLIRLSQSPLIIRRLALYNEMQFISIKSLIRRLYANGLIVDWPLPISQTFNYFCNKGLLLVDEHKQIVEKVIENNDLNVSKICIEQIGLEFHFEMNETQKRVEIDWILNAIENAPHLLLSNLIISLFSLAATVCQQSNNIKEVIHLIDSILRVSICNRKEKVRKSIESCLMIYRSMSIINHMLHICNGKFAFFRSLTLIHLTFCQTFQLTSTLFQILANIQRAILSQLCQSIGSDRQDYLKFIESSSLSDELKCFLLNEFIE